MYARSRFYLVSSRKTRAECSRCSCIYISATHKFGTGAIQTTQTSHDMLDRVWQIRSFSAAVTVESGVATVTCSPQL